MVHQDLLCIVLQEVGLPAKLNIDNKKDLDLCYAVKLTYSKKKLHSQKYFFV